MSRILQPTDVLLSGRTLADEGILIDKFITPYSTNLHQHNFIELAYTFYGEVTHFVNGEKLEVSRGDLIFINYNQTHEYVVKDEMCICNILIEPKFLCEELINSFNALDLLTLSAFSEFSSSSPEFVPFVRFPQEQIPTIENLIHAMIREYEQKDIGYKGALKAMCEQLLIYVFRQMRTNASTREMLKSLDKISPKLLEDIQNACSEKISMAEYARRCFYAPSYFSRHFKNSCGCTFTEYVQKTRIEKAKRLIVETEKNIDEIAWEVGYHDKKQFYSVFTKYCGKTPGEFRKNHD